MQKIEERGNGMKKALWLIVIVLLALSAFLLFGRHSDKKPAAGLKTIVTTIYPLYFITREIAGDSITVKRLIKPGSEIHSFSPTPAEMVALDRADLLITLGKELEPWTEKLTAATSVKVLSLIEGLSLIDAGEEHHAEHAGHHHHSTINPHVWLDFGNDIKMAEKIAGELARIYPEKKALFEKNVARVRRDFEKVALAYSQGLKQCSKKTILVGHDAFAYLERRYGFTSESIMGIFAHSRPNAARIAALSGMIKEKNLHYLFTDPIESSKSASQLAADMNLTLEPLYTLGNIPLEDEKKGKDMITLLYFDLAQLRKGLECR
jgi:zinc transport system substrate-binding protein